MHRFNTLLCGSMSTRLTGTGTRATLDEKGWWVDEFSATDRATPRLLQALSFSEDKSALAADSRCHGQMQILPVQLYMLQMVVDILFADAGLLGNLPGCQLIFLQEGDNGMADGFMLLHRNKGLARLRLSSYLASPSFPGISSIPIRQIPSGHPGCAGKNA